MGNQNPEQIARDKIDQMLVDAGWLVQFKKKVDLSANKGVAVREYQIDVGPADYVLFVDRLPVGIIEAKREDEGFKLTVVEEQSKAYPDAKLKYLNNDPLPFVYESTGTITRFTDYRDPKPRGRIVFSFFKPETIVEWLHKVKSLRNRLPDIPEFTWRKLRIERTREFECEIADPPNPNDWFKVIININNKKVEVYVNEISEPVLTFDRLASTKSNKIGI